jgi:P27 family predicted phage terminase small subunit
VSAPDHLPETARVVWDEVVARWGDQSWKVEGAELEAYCTQIARMRDAQKRVDTEGLIVADEKGRPVPHPGLALEKQAHAEVRAWGGRFMPSRRMT